MNIISQILYWFWIIFLNIKQRFILKPSKIIDKKPISIDYEKKYAKYINFYKNPTSDANMNINTDLYDYKTRKELFKNNDNQEEKLWRSRILIENMEQGNNILMYYDCYRMAFTYHSDAQVISRKALYYAAMKYVVIYSCRNFFIDMELNPENPMHNVFQAEDEEMKTKTAPKSNISNNNVFVKAKKPTQKTVTQKIEINKYTNKYSRVNKICEHNILQKPPCKKIAYVNSLLFGDKPLVTMDDFFDDLDIKETSTLFLSQQMEQKPEPIKQGSYAAFKKQQQQS